MVRYTLREDLMKLIVCLYNPSEIPEMQFTTDTLHNYICDCAWQLAEGKQIKRFPFHVSSVKADVDAVIEEMNRTIRKLNHEKEQKSQTHQNSVSDHSSWGYNGGYPLQPWGKAEGL